MKIKYRLFFLSDWHIGSGSGIPGVVDNGVLKNNQNVPVINGKTIKGITRDALEDLLYFIKAPDHSDVMETIFGWEGDKEGNAVFHNPSICMDESDKKGSDYKEFLKFFEHRDIGDIRYHTAIDSETGTASKHQLFSEETSEKCFEFFGHIEIDEAYAKYLIAALKFTTKIGGKRRRGLGQCEFQIREPENCEFYLQELFK